MPLCPRCGAAHRHDDEVCRECGKRLREKPRVAANQTSLSFPTCVDGPLDCEGPAVRRPDGRLRCSTHHLATRFKVKRIPDSTFMACNDGPEGCSGVVTLAEDGQLRCEGHRKPPAKAGWRSALRRWFGTTSA
jgi:hypothetical protein